MNKKKRIIIGICIGILLLVYGIFIAISEKDTIKNEKSKVTVNKEERTITINTGAVAFGTEKESDKNTDSWYVFDEKHPSVGAYAKYDFAKMLDATNVKAVNYNSKKRGNKLCVYMNLKSIKKDENKKIKKVNVTFEVKARCDLKDFREEVDTDLILENRGTVKNELLDRNETFKHTITKKSELGRYVLVFRNMWKEKVNWSFDITVKDNSIYE